MNEENDIIKIADFSFNFDTLFENTIIISSDLKVENLLTFEISSIYELVNVSTFNIEKRLPHRYSDILGVRYENQYFSSNIKRTTLRSLSLLTGEYEWEVDLAGIGSYTDHYGEHQAGKIEHIFGVWNQLLWVWLEGYQCVGIDVQTGQVKQHWFPFKGRFQAGHFFFNFPHFDAKGTIQFFERQYWISIDLASQQTKTLWQAAPFEINASNIQEAYIYFIAVPPGSVFSNIVGVFDQLANKIVWSTQLELARYITLTAAPQVAGNKLYVLDSDGTLHIFEREPTT
ncbi:MAG: hypothetical protein U0Y10_01365 [Spirosomataceae bacterium]